MLICMQKMGTLGMSGYVYVMWYYELVENIRVYLQAKNQLRKKNFLRFSGDTAMICKLLILGTSDMPGYAYPKR